MNLFTQGTALNFKDDHQSMLLRMEAFQPQILLPFLLLHRESSRVCC